MSRSTMSSFLQSKLLVNVPGDWKGEQQLNGHAIYRLGGQLVDSATRLSEQIDSVAVVQAALLILVLWVCSVC